MNDDSPQPTRARTRFLSRYVIASDNHGFVGRIYDLGIVSLHFDSYEELSFFPDCKYVVDTGDWVSMMTSRVESLNLVGNMLWPDPLPASFKEMPITRYEWLTIATDVFLMRYVSVIDCALLLVNQVLQLGFKPEDCKMRKLSSKIPVAIKSHLLAMINAQENIRRERNARIHHGRERQFTDDDVTFKMASLFNDKLHGMTGTDRYGRRINVERSFRQGLVGVQRDYNRLSRQLVKQLDQLYDLLWDEFESRFGPLVINATHGLNARSKTQAN